MLHDGEQLDVGEAHFHGVVADGVRELPICQEAVFVPREPAARSRGAPRRSTRGRRGRCAAAAAHPLLIAPLYRQVPHHRGRARRRLAVEGERVRLIDRVARLLRDYVILVERARPHSRDEGFPDPGGVGATRQRMCRGIPTVEIAHDHTLAAFGAQTAK